MKLWIDGQALQTASRQRGIGRYVREFIRAVSVGEFELDVAISFNAAMSDEAISARTDVQQWIDPSNIHVWQGVAEAGEADIGYSERRRLSEVALSHHVACLKPDVALSASPFEGAQDVAVPLCPMKPSSSNDRFHFLRRHSASIFRRIPYKSRSQSVLLSEIGFL